MGTTYSSLIYIVRLNLSGWLRHCARVIEFMYRMYKKVDPIVKIHIGRRILRINISDR